MLQFLQPHAALHPVVLPRHGREDFRCPSILAQLGLLVLLLTPHRQPPVQYSYLAATNYNYLHGFLSYLHYLHYLQKEKGSPRFFQKINLQLAATIFTVFSLFCTICAICRLKKEALDFFFEFLLCSYLHKLHYLRYLQVEIRRPSEGHISSLS